MLRPTSIPSRVLVVTLALALHAGCGSVSVATATTTSARAASALPASATSDAVLALPTASTREEPRWKGAHEARTDDGRFLVRWRAAPEPIPEGANFALEAWVFDGAHPEQLVDDIGFDFDASMPQHGHGMNRLARVTKLAPGAWRAEGLLFHMPGRWQLAFDITRGARTDRARAEVELE